MASVTIKRLTIGDASLLYGVVARNRDYLQNMWWAAEATLDSTRTHLSTTKDVMYGVYTHGALCGVVSLRPLRPNVWMLGYWLGLPFRGMGVATEAARLLLNAYFVGETSKQQVVAMTLHTNVASQRVLHKLGFTPEPVTPGFDWRHYTLEIVPHENQDTGISLRVGTDGV